MKIKGARVIRARDGQAVLVALKPSGHGELSFEVARGWPRGIAGCRACGFLRQVVETAIQKGKRGEGLGGIDRVGHDPGDIEQRAG